MKTNKIFKKLNQFRKLPTYQLERRIDAFLFPYLEDGIKNNLSIRDDNLKFIYPEFPLKRLDSFNFGNDIRNDRLSEYADYLLFSSDTNTVYLVEFKTDVNSLHKKQFETYYKNCKAGWEELLNYYFDRINKRNWRKFVHGLIHLHAEAPELLGGISDLDLEKYLEKSRGVHEHLDEIKKQISFNEEPALKFIYLAPQDAEGDLKEYASNYQIEYIAIHPEIEGKDFYMGLVTLNQFADSISDISLKALLKEIDPKE